MESQLRCIRTLAHKASYPTFSSDGKTLVSFSSKDKTANVWDVNTGELKNTFTGLKEIVFSVDRKILAGNYDDNTIKLWNVGTGELKHSLTGHPSGIIFIALSPDGQTLVSRDKENIKLWDVETGELKHSLTAHSSEILSISFSPDSKTLVSRDKETIKLWNTCTGELISTIAKRCILDWCSNVTNLENSVFSPNGQYLAIASSEPQEGRIFHKTTTLWNMETGKESGTLNNTCGAIAFSHDGKILFISCKERQQEEVGTPGGVETYSVDVRYTRMWDLTTNQTKTFHSEHFCDLSPDGQFVITAQEYDDGMNPLHEKINIIDVGTGKTVKSFPRGTRAKLSPDGKILAVSEGWQLLHLIDWHSGKSIATLSGGIYNFTFSPDGNILAVGDNDTIKLWQESTEPILKQQLHGNAYPHLKRLENFLASELWSDADLETADVIKHFPSQDLNVIDQLWVHYSNGRYGFSVQKQIWESVRHDYNLFQINVGWGFTAYRRNLYHDSGDDSYIAECWHTTNKGYYPRAVGIGLSEIFSRLGD
jgi:WD40 repeat protein